MKNLLGGEGSYWNFDEGAGGTLSNQVNGGQQLTITGISEWAEEASPTKFRNTGSLDVSLCYLQTSTPVTPAGSFSLSVWLMQQNPTSSQFIINQRDHVSAAAMDWQLFNHGGADLRFSSAWLPGDLLISRDYLPLNTWSHVAVSVDDLGKVTTAYLDGKLVTAAEYAGPVQSESRLTISGRGWSTSQSRFGGYVDELRVFSRAISPWEVALLASGGPNPRRYDPFRSHAFHAHRIGGMA